MRAIVPMSLAALIFAFGCGGNDSPTGPTAPAKNPPPTASPSPSPSKPAGTKHGRIYFATASAGGMSISTDKDDYSPGDTVHFTGTGWTPNDTLNALLSEATTGVKLTWTIPVAVDGTFRDSTYVVSTSDLGGTFTLTVTSKSNPAQTLTVNFTDAQLTVKAQPDGVQFVLGVTNYSALNCTGTATVQPPDTIKSTNTGFPIGGGGGSPLSIMFTAAATSMLGAPFSAWSGGGTVQADTKMVCVSSAISMVATYTAAPDLVIGKTHTGSFPAGGTGQYKISVSNSGTASAKGQAPSQKIAVTDTLPTGLTYGSAQSPLANSPNAGKWTCGPSGQVVTCSYAPGQDILPATSADDLYLTVNVAANAPSSVTNHASVSSGSVTESDITNNSATDVTAITGIGPTKLAFATSAFTVVVGQCSPKITVQTQTAAGTPANPSTAVTVNLTSTSTGAAFYSDASCTTAITSVSIPTSGNSADFYYKDSKAGSPTLTVADAAAILTQAQQTETVNKAATSVSLSKSPTGNSVFGQSVTFTATVTATAPGSGTPDGNVKFYKFAAGGTCTAPNGSLLGTKTLNGSGQAQLAVDTLSVSGSPHTISACYQGSSNYVASGNSIIHTVDPAQVTSTASVSPSTQQYSDKDTLRTSIGIQSPGALAGDTLKGSVDFYIGTTKVGTVSGVKITSVPSTVTLTPLYALVQAAGSYTVTARFTSTNPNFSSTSAATGETTATLTVTQEDATIQLPTFGSVLYSLSSFTFTVRVMESYDFGTNTEPNPNPNNGLVAPGDMANIGSLSGTMAGISTPSSYPFTCPTLVGSGGTGYTSYRDFQCTVTGGPFVVDAYDVTVAVPTTNLYYTGSNDDALSVYDPASGFVTGGGTVTFSGDRVSFGLSYTYAGGTKNTVRGGLVVVRHLQGGGRCRLKSNQMNAPSVTSNYAYMTGKGNYACVDAYGYTTASAGNLSLLGYVQDNATPGAGADKFQINGSTSSVSALMPKLAMGIWQYLTGGNIQVPQPSKK